MTIHPPAPPAPPAPSRPVQGELYLPPHPLSNAHAALVRRVLSDRLDPSEDGDEPGVVIPTTGRRDIGETRR